MLVIAIALIGSMLNVAGAPAPAQCAEGRLFQSCVDQRALLAAARARAGREGKRMLLVYGYDGCAWSRAMIEILSGPEAAGLREKFVVVPIVASRHNRSGQALMCESAQAFGAAAAQTAGVP